MDNRWPVRLRRGWSRTLPVASHVSGTTTHARTTARFPRSRDLPGGSCDGHQERRATRFGARQPRTAPVRAAGRDRRNTLMAVVTMKQMLESRRPLRAPDPALEPEDEALHLHRAQRHLHHRPAADADLHRPRLRVRQGDRRPRRHGPVRRHQEAGPGGRSPSRRPASACPTSTSAGWAACSPTSRPSTSGCSASRSSRRWSRPAGTAPPPRRSSSSCTREKDKLERTLGGIREMTQGPERGVDRRHQEGAHRRRRGAQAGHPGHRDPRHQLRPRRGRLQDPGQRRRDPLAPRC